MSNLNLRNKEINKALTIKLDVIPDKIPEFQEHIRRAPKRESKLTNADIKLALKKSPTFLLYITFFSIKSPYLSPALLIWIKIGFPSLMDILNIS